MFAMYTELVMQCGFLLFIFHDPKLYEVQNLKVKKFVLATFSFWGTTIKIISYIFTQASI